MNIEGPVTLRSMHSARDNRTVVVLGEFHYQVPKTPELLCPRDGVTPTLTLIDYLDVLFSLGREQRFDLFAELPPGAEAATAEPRAALPMIQTHYGACIQRLRTCPFPNVRVHYTDWRPFHQPVNDIIHRFLFADADPLTTAYELLLNDVTPAQFRARILASQSLQKQLAKTRPDAAGAVLADLERATAAAQARMDALMADVNSVPAAAAYTQTVIDMWVSVVDYYLLARVFKPETSAQVIVYVGEAHRVHIQELLTQLGYALQVSVGEREPPRYCVHIDKQPGFFFAPLADHPPPTPGYAELVALLSRPTFSFETSWYASEYSIIRIMAIYFLKQTSAVYAYRRMHISSGIYFSFQKVRDSLALFVHSSQPPPAAPPVADALLLPTKKQIKLEDTSVRALFIYRDAYARLSPLAQVMLDFLIANTKPAPDSNLAVLLEIKNP
jgi:hypothetical protein